MQVPWLGNDGKVQFAAVKVEVDGVVSASEDVGSNGPLGFEAESAVVLGVVESYTSSIGRCTIDRRGRGRVIRIGEISPLYIVGAGGIRIVCLVIIVITTSGIICHPLPGYGRGGSRELYCLLKAYHVV